MDFTKKERDLLSILADEWEKTGPPGYLETSLIAERLNVSIEDAKSIIQSLFVKGLVDTDEVEIFAGYLTPEGYELARKE